MTKTNTLNIILYIIALVALITTIFQIVLSKSLIFEINNLKANLAFLTSFLLFTSLGILLARKEKII